MTTRRNEHGQLVAEPRRRWWPTIRRDSVLWLLGLGLTLNELVVRPDVRAEALVFCGLLLGLPGVLAANDFAKRVVAGAGALAEPEDP